MKYTTIVFDLGNVLIPFDHSMWITNFNKIEPGLGNLVFKKFKANTHIQMEYEGGKISDEEFIKICLNWLDHKINAEEFCQIFSNIFTFNDDVIDLLPKLGEKYKLVLLSNTSRIHKDYAWGEYPFINYFDKLILSHEVKAVKPEPIIYKSVEKYTEEEPESHIFIDDILEYVEGAKKLGWDGIHFTGYDNLVDEFKARGILP